MITAASFIPGEQEQKLAILADLKLLIEPTLTPDEALPPPSDDEVLTSMAGLRTALQPIALREVERGASDSPAIRLARALDGAAARGMEIIPDLERDLLTGLEQRLDTLRTVIDARPVTLVSLPPQLRGSWIAPDGRARIEIFPKGDARNQEVLKQFVTAVRSVAPDVTGTPVTIQEAGQLISSAFLEAGIMALSQSPSCSGSSCGDCAMSLWLSGRYCLLQR